MTLKEKLAAAQQAADAPSALAYDAMFSNSRSPIHINEKQIVMLPVNCLHPFHGHTFQLHEGAPDYLALKESIGKNGIQEPIIVRPHPTLPSAYEIIVGHRRHHIASCELNLPQVPCVIINIDDAHAAQLMGESNISRPDWLPSEKAKTYAAHLAATKAISGIKAGRPSDNNSGHSAPNLRNRDEAAKIWGIDGKTFDRYLKLNDLIPSLLDLVDMGRISVVAGYHIAFLPENHQRLVAQVIATNPSKKIDTPKGATIRQASEDGALTERYLLRVLEVASESSPKQGKPIRISLVSSTLTKSNTIRKALDDADVLEKIEAILIDYANGHNLPLN